MDARQDAVGRSGHPGTVEQPDVDAAASDRSTGALAGQGDDLRRRSGDLRANRIARASTQAPQGRRSRHVQRVLARRGKGVDANIAHHRSAGRPRSPLHAGGGEAARGGAWTERSQRGPADTYDRPQPVDALHLARLERHRQLVQQQLPDLPVARLRRRLSGADSRAAHHSARRAAASAAGRRPVAGRLARSLGGQHARRRDDELRSADRASRARARRCTSSNATRRVDANTLDYQFTIDDPKTFTRPWTVSRPMRRQTDGITIFEYACHEGNYAMTGILAGARFEERAGKAGKAAGSVVGRADSPQ